MPKGSSGWIVKTVKQAKGNDYMPTQYKSNFLKIIFLLFIFCFIGNVAAFAAQPVRISVTAGGGSGIEQEAVDKISYQLSNNPNVVISTVNPDWYVVCKIEQALNQLSGQIRYNGTVTIKSADGQIINTVSMQKYNQDINPEDFAAPSTQSSGNYSPYGTNVNVGVTLNTAQSLVPLNKKLVDSAVHEVTEAMSSRACEDIEQALVIEVASREQLDTANQLAAHNEYDQALAALSQVDANSLHYKESQKLSARFQMEKHCLQLINQAQINARKKQYLTAIALLRQVDKNSKRAPLARIRIASYRQSLLTQKKK